MPREILHHDGLFVEWTTVAEGPCTALMSEAQMRHHLYRSERLDDASIQEDYHPSWSAQTRCNVLADVELKRKLIDRRIERAKRNGASGFRWYDEEFKGEMWEQEWLSKEQIFERLREG